MIGGWTMRMFDFSLSRRRLRFAIEGGLRLGPFLAVFSCCTGESRHAQRSDGERGRLEEQASPPAYRNREAVEPDKGRAAPTRSRITCARRGRHSARDYQPVQPVRLMMDPYQ